LDLASLTLRLPPRKDHIVRPESVGYRLARFVVPLDLLPSNNPWGRLEGWQKADLIKKLRGHIAPQLSHLRSMPIPLQGRPMIRAIRFSSTEGDVDNGWTKLAIDRLTVRSNKRKLADDRLTVLSKSLGVIGDDRPSKLNLKVWWEYAPAGKGFGYFEIWSGDQQE
jgi:hypothetical protein